MRRSQGRVSRRRFTGTTRQFRQLLRHRHRQQLRRKGPARVVSIRGSVARHVRHGRQREGMVLDRVGARRFIPGGGLERAQLHVHRPRRAGTVRPPADVRLQVREVHQGAARAAFRCDRSTARDFTQEKPVGDEIFEVIRRMYAYDRRPLNEAVDAVEEEGGGARRPSRSTPATATSACRRICSCRRTPCRLSRR